MTDSEGQRVFRKGNGAADKRYAYCAERGVIYDTNGKELAVSVTCYTIWVRPSDVKAADEDGGKKDSAEKVSRDAFGNT